MALSNEILTARSQQLQAQVVTIGEEIKTMLPSMKSSTETLRQELNTMDNNLNLH